LASRFTGRKIFTKIYDPATKTEEIIFNRIIFTDINRNVLEGSPPLLVDKKPV